MISPEKIVFKGPTISNKQYCMVGQTLDWRDGDNADLMISIDINENFIVLIRGVEQDSDLGVKCFH